MTEDDKEIKLMALDQAIRSQAGHSYNDEGKFIIDPNKILEAAKKFETYLKEEKSNV